MDSTFSDGTSKCSPTENLEVTPVRRTFKLFVRKPKTLSITRIMEAKSKPKNLHPWSEDGEITIVFAKWMVHDFHFGSWDSEHGKFSVRKKKLTRFQVNKLINKVFAPVPYSENRYTMVKGDYSPFNGDITYWSKRNSLLYNGATSKALKKQNHICGHCGLSFLYGQRVHLHHRDGNHNNWKPQNLLAVHQSCHNYIHMSKG